MRGDFGSARPRAATGKSKAATANNPYAAIILLRAGRQNAQATRHLRDVVAGNGLEESLLVLAPEVRGADFFSEPTAQLAVDQWWKMNVPPDAFPLYVVDADSAISDWLDSVDGHFFICERGESTTDVVNEGDNVTHISGSPDADVLASAIWNRCFPGTSLPRRAPKRAPRARAGARSKAAFQRARLGDGEELAPLKRNMTKAANASEAFFQLDAEDKRDVTSYAEITETAEALAVESSVAIAAGAPETQAQTKASNNFASELISVLGDTISRLQRMTEAERVPA